MSNGIEKLAGLKAEHAVIAKGMSDLSKRATDEGREFTKAEQDGYNAMKRAATERAQEIRVIEPSDAKPAKSVETRETKVKGVQEIRQTETRGNYPAPAPDGSMAW